MYLWKKNNKLMASGIATALIIAMLFLPFEFAYNIHSVGLVTPMKEWILSRGQDGNLISTLKDNSIGKLSSYSVTTFQRGYEARLFLNPNLYHYSRICKGDTIATMFSNKDEEQLVQLQGELNILNSELHLYTSGQKAEDVQGVFQRVALARQELEMQRKMTHRSVSLFKDSLISTQEYETALNTLRTRELEVKIAESTYNSVATGGKPEQIQFISAKIESIKQQILQIKNGLRDFILVSPISGVAVQKKNTYQTEEVLVAVADTSANVILFPVSYEEKNYLAIGQAIEVAITGTFQKCRGTIIGIDNTVQIVDGRQAFFVTAILKEKNLPIVSGTLLKTTVLGEPLTVTKYIARAVYSTFVY